MAFKKVVIIVLGSVVGIFAAAIIYISVLINPNDYKPEIIQQVKINSGGEMLIDGDIGWRFFPNIGVTLGHTQINNPNGFPEQPLVQFDDAQVDLAFWPLLSKKIKVGLISIKGLSLYLHTRKDGLTNLQAMQDAAQKTTAINETKPAATSQSSIDDLAIEGIQVVDAKVIIVNLAVNLATPSKQSIEAINFTLGKLELDKVVALSFSAAVDTGEISALITSKGQIKITKDFSRFDFIDLATEITAKGDSLPGKKVVINNQASGYFDVTKQFASVNPVSISLLGIDINGKLSAQLGAVPNIDYELKIGDVDLDALLPKTEEEVIAEKSEQAIDLSWMKDFNLKGLVSIKSVKASNLTISNINLPLELKDAQLKLTALKAELYEGDILSNVMLDGRKSIASFSVNAKLNNVKALPLVKDLMDKELISGTANLSVEMNGNGLDDLSIRKNTKGKGRFTFTDGAVQGVNVAELIRSTYARIKGQTLPPSDAPAQTDFASFTGSFNLDNGVVDNSDLSLLSPLLRISGNGQANIIDETVNYHLNTAIVGTLNGQGGEPIEDLKSLSIPLKIKGAMADPSISLDMNKLFNSQLKEKAKDKVKNKLKKLFGN